MLHFLAEEKGFEPLLGVTLLAVFETAPFSRLGIPPWKIITQKPLVYLQISIKDIVDAISV